MGDALFDFMCFAVVLVLVSCTGMTAWVILFWLLGG